MSARNIVTVFYFRRNILKTNKAVHVNTAVLNCVNHLQLNNYGASIAEVFNEAEGVLHAVITRNIKGNISIVYKR